MMKSVNFCPNCGEKLLKESNFCPKCGYDLTKYLTKNTNVTSGENPQPTESSFQDLGHGTLPRTTKMVKETFSKFIGDGGQNTNQRVVAALIGLVLVIVLIGILSGSVLFFNIVFLMAVVVIPVLMIVGMLTYSKKQSQITDDRADSMANISPAQKFSRLEQRGVYTVRIREFITVIALLAMVASVYFGNFFTLTLPITNQTMGMPLSNILNDLGYFSNDAKQLLIALSALPALGMVFVIIPNFFGRLLSLIFVGAGDVTLGYIIYRIYQYQDYGKLLDLSAGISFLVMIVAAGVASLFVIASLFPKRMAV